MLSQNNVHRRTVIGRRGGRYQQRAIYRVIYRAVARDRARRATMRSSERLHAAVRKERAYASVQRRRKRDAE